MLSVVRSNPRTNMVRFSDTPIWLRLTGVIWLMMVIAFGSMIVWETRVNRDMAIE